MMFLICMSIVDIITATTPSAATGVSGLNRFLSIGSVPTTPTTKEAAENFTSINLSPGVGPARRTSRSDTGNHKNGG